jgi:hypothetical protein
VAQKPFLVRIPFVSSPRQEFGILFPFSVGKKDLLLRQGESVSTVTQNTAAGANKTTAPNFMPIYLTTNRLLFTRRMTDDEGDMASRQNIPYEGKKCTES